ncbi:aldo/keto reductase [Tabrizicola sp. J26]|uniref:aldo/keto reductase n=1 Tax=Alitabrizicola rongguiensis TaxID=2909234 RepID=UPI001F2975BF|nr:aldo/keto reductase [Tabrizicola rongguiensis]MCF1707200.1 aldo/keto reductase [Tabrizicola rongguiensis]
MTPKIPFNDGHAIPALGFGLWQVPADQTARVTREGLQAGYRLVDGAAIYGNEEGQGEGIRNSGVPRDEIFVTTKCWNSDQGYDKALRAFDASLKRLGLERVDLYLIHWPCPDKNLFVDTWRALIRLREEGRATSIGVSNFHSPHLERLIAETGVTPALNQIELNPRLQQAALRAAHARMGIVTQSWTPLGERRSFDHPVVQGLAQRTGKSPAQVILRWHLQLGCSVIPRSTRAAGLAENLDLFGFELTEAEMASMATLDMGERCGPNPDRFS